MEEVEDASAQGWGLVEQQGYDDQLQQEGFDEQQVEQQEQQQPQGWTQVGSKGGTGPIIGLGGGGVQQGNWKGKGKGKEKSMMPWVNGNEQLYWGQVRCYNHEKTHGLIFCEDIFYRYGQEVYAYKDVLAAGGAGPGDTVVFYLHWSKRDQPQASKPLVRIGAENGFALEGSFKAGSKGFGFFECALTMEIFGRDVYVNPDLAGQFQLGQQVVFNAKLNRDLMPNAVSAEAAPPGWEPTPGDLSQTWASDTVEERFARHSSGKGGGKKGGGGGGGGYGDSGGDWSIGGGGGAVGGGGGKGDKNSGGGFGGGGKGPPIGGGGGQVISAPPSAARSGAAQQSTWPPVGGGSQKGPNPTGESYLGVVKSFNTGQNYGFITNEDVQAGYGVDCFVHGTNIQGGGTPNVGDFVAFDLAVNHKGSPQALNVKAVAQSSLLAQVFPPENVGNPSAGLDNSNNNNSSNGNNNQQSSTVGVTLIGAEEGEIDLAAVEHAILNPGSLTTEDYATYMHALQLCADQGSNEAAELATQLESSYTSHVVSVGSAQASAEGAGPAAKRQKVSHGYSGGW